MWTRLPMNRFVSSSKASEEHSQCLTYSEILCQRFSVPVLLCMLCMSLLFNTDSDHQLLRREFSAWSVFPLTWNCRNVYCVWQGLTSALKISLAFELNLKHTFFMLAWRWVLASGQMKTKTKTTFCRRAAPALITWAVMTVASFSVYIFSLNALPDKQVWLDKVQMAIQLKPGIHF